MQNINNKYLIGISGGSGSGKTTIAMELCNILGEIACFISEDDYYKDTSLMEGFDSPDFDFDHPQIRDHIRLENDLEKYRQGIIFEQPLYDFVNHCRLTKTKPINPKPILIMEGTHLLVKNEIRTHFDLKIYIDTDEQTRFSRRLKRDICERGRNKESVEAVYEKIVKPAHYLHTEPTRKFADIILDCNGNENSDYKQAIQNNINFILQFMKTDPKNAVFKI